jgi:hypothetical protein
MWSSANESGPPDTAMRSLADGGRNGRAACPSFSNQICTRFCNAILHLTHIISPHCTQISAMSLPKKEEKDAT